MAFTVFDWDVTLPERGASSFGKHPATALLHIESETHGTEDIPVPKSVGRVLAAKKDADELVPASRAELLYRVAELERAAARLKVEDLLNRRDYSRVELASKLRLEGYRPDVVDEVCGRLEEVGLLDDARFADLFIRSKLACGWGRVKIERELSRRGVDASEVEGWPEAYLDRNDEAEAAFELASRRRLTGRNDYQKIVRFLCGRGYPMGVAIDAARRVLAEADE